MHTVNEKQVANMWRIVSYVRTGSCERKETPFETSEVNPDLWLNSVNRSTNTAPQTLLHRATSIY